MINANELYKLIKEQIDNDGGWLKPTVSGDYSDVSIEGYIDFDKLTEDIKKIVYSKNE